MLPLIDGDILLYELGFSGEIFDEDSGEIVPLSFDRVAELLDRKIELICEDVEATEPPILFLTGRKDVWNNPRLVGSEEPFKPNFREKIAVTKPYKGTRKAQKPFHFYNLWAYMLATYDCRVANGVEADDEMSIFQRKHPEDTIICSRDKDLRQVPGWHFSWECGAQAALGPTHTGDVGWIQYDPDKNKLFGYGLAFLYSQMLTGDVVDNIPGLPRWGPRKAWDVLEHCHTADDFANEVTHQYQMAKGGEWLEYFQEQHTLLKMLDEEPEDG